MKTNAQIYTIVSDSKRHYYCVPAEKEEAFKAWVSARDAGQDYEGSDDFDDYRTDPPGVLTRMLFTKQSIN